MCACETVPRFPVKMVFVQGEQVVIQGLVSRSDLNGKHGHVLGLAIDGRVHVAIDQGRVTTLRVKEENLAYNRKDKVRKPAYQGNSGAVCTMPREAVEHYNRGQRCSDRGDNEGARSAWEAALSLSTDGAAATVLLNLGQLHGRCGRIELCKQYTRRSIAADPNQPLAHCNLGSALSNGGSHAEALACADPPPPPLATSPAPHTSH